MVVGNGHATAQEVLSSDWGEAERHAYVFQAAQRGSLVSVAFGSDGAHVAVATSAGYVSVVDAHAGIVLASRRLDRTSALAVSSLQIEPHGRWVMLVGSSEGTGGFARRWDPNADTTRDVAIDELGSYDVVLSPDASRLLTITDGTLTARRATDAHVLAEAPHASAELYWPDRRGIVAYERGTHTLEVIDPAHLTVRATLTGARAIAMDAAHHRVFARTDDAIVALDLATGRETTRVARPLDATATSPALVVSSDGSRVALVDTAASSTVVALDGRTEDRTLEGQVLWLSRTRAIIRAIDGTLGRHVIATGGRSSWVSRSPIEASAVFIGADGTAVFERAGHLEMSSPDGTRSSISTEGEHSVWWASTDGSRLAIGGRFGLDLWEATGIRPLSSCEGYVTHRFDSGGALVSGARECDVATGRSRAYAGAGPRVSDSGVVTGTDRGRVQLRGARRECFDDEGGEGCDPDLRVEAGGHYVVMEQSGDVTGEPGDSQLFEVASGRLSATLPAREPVVVDPEGRWAAAVSAEHVALVLLPSGSELMHVGATPEEPYDRNPTPFAVSGDGTRLAVRHQGGVRVLDATSGRLVATIPAPGADEIALSRNGTTIAIRTGHAVRSGLIGAALATAPEITGTLAGVFCSGGHAYLLDRSGPGLPRRDLGTCLTDATLEGDGRYLVATSEGVVRVRRLSTGTELTFRSIRGEDYDLEGNPLPRTAVIHFAHDARGHYWTDATGEVPVRMRDAAGALVPLDPALADPHLLTQFFGGTS